MVPNGVPRGIFPAAKILALPIPLLPPPLKSDPGYATVAEVQKLCVHRSSFYIEHKLKFSEHSPNLCAGKLASVSPMG